METIAEGLAARITADLNFSIVRQYVEKIILVSDREIIAATLFLLEHAKVLAEPFGSARLAGLLANPRKKAVALIRGANVALERVEALRRAP